MSAIQVTLNFSSEQDLLAFFANKKAIVHQPGLPLESGEFIPAEEMNKGNAAARNASGQATAKADAAPGKTAKNKDTAAASAGTEQPASTAATTSQATGAGEQGNAAAASTGQAATGAPAASSVDYSTLQKAVFALATKSRDAATTVAAEFGVKTFKELASNPTADPKVEKLVEKEPGLFAKALAAVEAKIAELG